MPKMLHQHFALPAVLAALLLATPSLSQDPNLLQGAPTCAAACVPLQGQATACVPPAVTPAPMASYKGCFCDSQRAAFTPDPGAYCACATDSDTNALIAWWVRQCGSEGIVTPTSVSVPVSTGIMTSTALYSSTQTGGPRPTRTHLPPPPQENKNQTWWQGHYQWIVMVIVLIIGFSIIIALGIYFKRRYDQKHSTRTPPLPTNSNWGPNTSQFRSSSVYESGDREKSRTSGSRSRHR